MDSRAHDILRRLRASALRRTRLRAGVALAYHRIGRETGSRERELVAPHGTALFEAQLRRIASRYRVVPPSQLQHATARRGRGEPYPLAITFDDDLPSHAGLAAELLARHGLPAAFFVSGASLSGPDEFWWERLQRVVDSGRAGPHLVEAVLGAGETPDDGTPLVKVLSRRIQILTGDERARVDALLTEAAGPPPASAGMRAADVVALAQGGFEVGFHTRRHEMLTELGDDELENAMTDGREELEALAGARIRAISYPHGRADARVAEAARRAGFEVGFTGRNESVRPSADPLLLGRVEPSFRSARHLETQLARAVITAPGAGGTTTR
jgi:peptidoglycan/xylan/chitin deacetylase (PgdA/CDA1 family)